MEVCVRGSVHGRFSGVLWQQRRRQRLAFVVAYSSNHRTIWWKAGAALVLKTVSSSVCASQSKIPTLACISGIPGAAAGGGNSNTGGGHGWGGGGGGGDGFQTSALPAQSVGGEPDDSAAAAQAVIVLDVGGMSCGGCAASVKRILESQAPVSSATVNLVTETAVIQVKPDAYTTTSKRELAEALAKHLTACGFKSAVREATP